MQLGDFRRIAFDNLERIFPPEEARAIIRLWLTERLNCSAHQLILDLDKELDDSVLLSLKFDLFRLMDLEPIQYVLGIAWFDGIKLEVDQHVLIPRPETEELVAWVAASYEADAPERVLDACTGSGCIALALKSRFPQSSIYALDISPQALEVARRNSINLGLPIELLTLDLLEPNQVPRQHPFDCLVCNPPYIDPVDETDSAAESVIKYEPHLALFAVPKDPTIFYRRLAECAIGWLKPGSYVFAELNSKYAGTVVEMWQSIGLNEIQTALDLQGRTRMIRARTNQEQL